MDGVCDGVCDGRRLSQRLSQAEGVTEVWLFGEDSFEECPLTEELELENEQKENEKKKLKMNDFDENVMVNDFIGPVRATCKLRGEETLKRVNSL